MTRVVLIIIGIAAMLGCKNTPTNSPEPPAPEAAGTYVGWGRPGGTGFNVRLTVAGSDTTEWTGAIYYGGSSSTLLITDVSVDEDSIRFEYTRGSAYRHLGVISGVAMTIFVLEPAGQPTYVLNRVQGSFNMSGDWDGLVYSQFLNITEDADLFMDHQGNLFNGDLESQFGFYSLLGNITNGGQQGSAFYLAGDAPYGGQSYPFQLDGNYVNPDSIVGVWILDVDGGGDSGSFAFGRRF
ncbi:hypothetical protein HUU59_02300 [bacterium]|nr:hypothetical protein [bacterium]